MPQKEEVTSLRPGAVQILTYNILAQSVIPIPLPVYMICMAMDYKNLEMVFSIISPAYGTNHFSPLV